MNRRRSKERRRAAPEDAATEERYVAPNAEEYQQERVRQPMPFSLRKVRRENRAQGRFRGRRLVWHRNRDTGERYQVEEKVEWKATQRSPLVARDERHAANKRARKARLGH